MKEEKKCLYKKRFFLLCILIGLVGTTWAFATFFNSCLGKVNAICIMLLPFIASCVILFGSMDEIIYPKMDRHIGQMVSQKDFLLFGGKLFLQTAGIVISSVLVLFTFLAFLGTLFFLARLLVGWLIQMEVLSAVHEETLVHVLALCILIVSSVIIYAFSKIFSD